MHQGTCTQGPATPFCGSFRSIPHFILLIGTLAWTCAQPAHASLFVSLSNNSTTLSCDNSTAGGVTSCGTLGFTTTLNSNSIGFTGSVGGYFVSNFNLGANAPGTPVLGDALDSVFNVQHPTGTGLLTVDFATYNMSAPSGPGLLLSGAQTAAWTVSTAGDYQTFQVWARPDNQPIVPGGGVGGATLPMTTCTSPGAPPVLSCSQPASPQTTPFTKTGNYALTGQEIISEAIGSQGNFTGQVDALAPVPEPAMPILLAGGLLGMALMARRKQAKPRATAL